MFIIEIIALIFFCKSNGQLALQKGVSQTTGNYTRYWPGLQRNLQVVFWGC